MTFTTRGAVEKSPFVTPVNGHQDDPCHIIHLICTHFRGGDPYDPFDAYTFVSIAMMVLWRDTNLSYVFICQWNT